MNSTANQSSSAGCVGGTPCEPKSFSVCTIPRPKKCCHMRLTATRARSGLFRSATQRAKSSRSPFVLARRCSTDGVPGCITSAGRVKSPCTKRRVVRGFPRLAITRVVAAAGRAFFSLARLASSGLRLAFSLPRPFNPASSCFTRMPCCTRLAMTSAVGASMRGSSALLKNANNR